MIRLTTPRIASALLAGMLLFGGSIATAGNDVQQGFSPVVPAGELAAPIAVTTEVMTAETNVATSAFASASYTAAWNSLGAVNNGTVLFAGGDQTALWGTWSGTRPASQWLQYEWDAPVRITASDISFWTDSAGGTGDNVAVPRSWAIEYQPVGSTSWTALPDPSGYGTVRGAHNVTTFGAVTTTAVRATFQGLPNAGGSLYSAVGVSEWVITGEFFVDPFLPLYVDEVHVPTTVGQVPTLPSFVVAIFEDGRRQLSAATWPLITTGQVAQVGSFVVTGTAAEVSGPVSATVWVRPAGTPTVTDLDPISVITPAKRRPLLPTTVVATYSDGSKDSSLPVVWDAIAASAYAREGEDFQVMGTVTGTALRASAFVIVDTAVGDADPEPPEVELSVAAAAVSNRDVVTATATLTGTEPFSGTLRFLAGEKVISSQQITATPAGTGFTAMAEVRDPASGLATGKRQYRVDLDSDNDGIPEVVSANAEVEIYFWDKTPGSPFYSEVLWLSDARITTGDSGGFNPGGLVSRQAMAAFLYRLQNPDQVPAVCASRPFPDVPADSQFCGEIAWLKTTGITGGYTDGTFRPGATIDRQAMAAFLFRLEHPGADKPICAAAAFADVPVSNQFCGEIGWLSEEGITTGYAGNRFQPTEKISRQAMAAFLFRLEHPTD